MRPTCHLRSARARGLRVAVAGGGQPGGRLGVVGVVGSPADPRPDLVGPRVAAEEAYVGAQAAQAEHGLAHPRVLDVALAVDREAVAAEAVAGRPGLDPGEVDTAYGELGEDLEQ